MSEKLYVDSPYLVRWETDQQGWNIADMLTLDPQTKSRKEEKILLKEIKKKTKERQKQLYAEQRQALLVVFQAMDAAGKDSTIRAVFSGINPQGCRVQSFKRPTPTEVAHDYLWRVHQETPQKGYIQIFNRSHYEEVLVTSVFPHILETQALPHRDIESEMKLRYAQIRNFEQLLSDTGTRVIKFFLNVSKEEQKNRLLRRTEDPNRHWKHESGDLTMRKHWNTFMTAYERAIKETSLPHAPWYMIPADNKPFMRRCVADIVYRTLASMNPQFPQVSQEDYRQIQQDRTTMLSSDFE